MLPDIYFYNPTCEIAVANGSENYMPKNLLRKMEFDLDLLPAYFASSKDILLVRKYPDPSFLDSLNEAGIFNINLQLLDESLKDPIFLSNPKGFLNPWGWSPAMHKLFSPLKPSCSQEYLNSPVAEWNPVHKLLYSRKTGKELLEKILENTHYKFFTPLDQLPQVCISHEEIYSLQQKWNQIIVKSPWSSSGRGLQILRPGEYNRTNHQVISGFLKHQGFVVVEPFYQKVLDISFQFISKGNGEIESLGICSFLTDRSGRYLGSYLEEIPSDLESSLRDFLADHLTITQKSINSALVNSPYSLDYRGWIGVDSIVYKNSDNDFIIQPCLEVNCRYTMGAIALAFRRRMAEDSGGFFRIHYMKDGLQQFFTEQKLRNPLLVKNNRIIKGFISLTPISGDTVFGASAEVDRIV